MHYYAYGVEDESTIGLLIFLKKFHFRILSTDAKAFSYIDIFT